MTLTEARKIIENHPNAINLVKESHLHELSDLVEVHIEVVKIRRDECTSKWDRGGSIFSPSDVAINRIGTAAGIEFEPTAEATRKEGPYVWVGKSQGRQRAPDGTWEYGAPCEYEWDAELRREENELKGKADWDNKDAHGNPGTKAYTEKELQNLFLEYRKFGCQRANTGARARAIVYLLGMKRGIKGLFPDKGEPSDTREFLVSRIIINAKNTMIAQAMVAQLANSSASLYGPQPAAQIAAPVEPAMRPVGPGHDEEPAPTGPQAGTAFDFDAPSSDPADQLRASLVEWANASGMPETVSAAINAVLDRDERRPEILEPMISLVKLVGDKRLGQKGISTVERVLLDPKMDAANLKEYLKAASQAAAVAGAA